MDADLAALSRANDVVNSINNTCKTFVKAQDGNIFILNQEGGLEERVINQDVIECNKALENSKSGDDLPIYIFTEKFKDDMLNTVYKSVIPSYDEINKFNLKIGMGCIPGLICIKSIINSLLGEYNLSNQITTNELDTFFNKHKCDNPLCASKDFFTMIKADSETPMLNVSHPEWIYNLPKQNEECEYVQKFIQYLKFFLNEPVSKKCVLCDIFFTLTESEDAVNLFGLPEEFIINETICNLYGKFSLKQIKSVGSLKIVQHKNNLNQEYYIVHLDNKIYYGL